MTDESDVVAPLQAADAATDPDETLALAIRDEIVSYWAGRPSKCISAPNVAMFLAGQAMEVVGPELRRLRSDLAAREENLKREAASWKDICDALSQQAAEAKLTTKNDANYIEWLCERLDESNAEMRKYRHACWEMAKKQTQDAAQPPSSEASPE